MKKNALSNECTKDWLNDWLNGVYVVFQQYNGGRTIECEKQSRYNREGKWLFPFSVVYEE